MDASIKQKLDIFFQQYNQVSFAQGEMIIRADEDPSNIIYLKEGIVRQYSVSKDGEEVTLNLFRPIAYFPMMSVFNKTLNRYYFEALTEVHGWKAPKEQVLRFLKENNDIMYNLVTRIYKGMDAMLVRMEYLLSGNAKTKIIFTILNAADRFGIKDESGIHIDLKMTHRDMAALSGVTRETFSREIKNLENKGLVKMEKTIITLINKQALEDELMVS